MCTLFRYLSERKIRQIGLNESSGNDSWARTLAQPPNPRAPYFSVAAVARWATDLLFPIIFVFHENTMMSILISVRCPSHVTFLTCLIFLFFLQLLSCLFGCIQWPGSARPPVSRRYQHERSWTKVAVLPHHTEGNPAIDTESKLHRLNEMHRCKTADYYLI